MIKRLVATIEILRPHNMLAASLCVLSGYMLAGGGRLAEILPPMAFAGLVAGLGNVINDYFDIDIDRVNKPRRPLPSGRLERPPVLAAYLAASVAAGFVAPFVLPSSQAAFVLAWEALLFVYAWKAKKIPLAGNILVAGVASSAFVAGAVAARNFSASLFPFFFAFIFVMGRELIKGAEDYEGDLAGGAETIAVRLGKDKSLLYSSFFLAACVAVAPLPVLAGLYGKTYFFIMEGLVVPGLVGTIVIVMRGAKPKVLNLASWILKLEMFFGIIAMGLAHR
jgi:geranylgeranylglycerol-phosphate geranylgeranyltransferase